MQNGNGSPFTFNTTEWWTFRVPLQKITMNRLVESFIYQAILCCAPFQFHGECKQCLLAAIPCDVFKPHAHELGFYFVVVNRCIRSFALVHRANGDRSQVGLEAMRERSRPHKRFSIDGSSHHKMKFATLSSFFVRQSIRKKKIVFENWCGFKCSTIVGLDAADSRWHVGGGHWIRFHLMHIRTSTHDSTHFAISVLARQRHDGKCERKYTQHLELIRWPTKQTMHRDTDSFLWFALYCTNLVMLVIFCMFCEASHAHIERAKGKPTQRGR